MKFVIVGVIADIGYVLFSLFRWMNASGAEAQAVLDYLYFAGPACAVTLICMALICNKRTFRIGEIGIYISSLAFVPVGFIACYGVSQMEGGLLYEEPNKPSGDTH